MNTDTEDSNITTESQEEANSVVTVVFSETNSRLITKKLITPLDSETHRSKGEELVSKLGTKHLLEEELKDVKKKFKTNISSVQIKIDKLCDEIENGIKQDVECRIYFDCPRKGQARIVRTDTDEEVEVREMTQAEIVDLQQMLLEYEDSDDQDEEPAMIDADGDGIPDSWKPEDYDVIPDEEF